MNTPHTRTVRLAGTMLALASLFIASIQRAPATPAAMGKKPSSRADLSTSLPSDDAANKMRISEAYGKLPMSFEPNRGQTDRRVKFLSRGSGYTLFLTPSEAMLALWNEKPSEERAVSSSSKNPQAASRNSKSSVLRMKLIGANACPKIEGRQQLIGKRNYLIGNDQAKWHTNIPTFAQVQYTDVYPGIDMVYYGQQRQLEYDFRLTAGADPNEIRIAFEGAENLKIDADGNLVLKTSGGEIIQRAPVIYQDGENGRQSIAGRYILRSEREVGFDISAYDSNRPLVIDPQLVYSTFYGGSDKDIANGIAVDRSGNAYITGETLSPNLSLINPFQSQLGGAVGNSDAFVMKLNANGSQVIYSTYIGGGFVDRANAITVTSDGKACITGVTNDNGDNPCCSGANNFPTTSNRFQGNGGNDRQRDAFVTVLTADGGGLFYSTFFGGTHGYNGHPFGNEDGLGIAVDSSDNIYVTGDTSSNDLPTKNAFQPHRASSDDGPDAFIAKFDPSANGGVFSSTLLYSSYLGGSGTDIGRAVAVDSVGNAYVVGNTFSSDLTTKAPDSLGPLQTSNNGGSDAFVAKIDPTNATGSASLVYSTYFGGAGTDRALAVAVDSSQRAYVTGSTDSTFPSFITKNAFQPNNAGGDSDAFVAKFNANGSRLFYSTFLGGSSFDEGRGIAIDSAGNAYVTGKTIVGFPQLNGLPSDILSGNTFITKIEPSDATGTTTPRKLYSDTFGGSEGNAIALDIKGNVYIAGSAGANLQTQGPGVFQQQPFQASNRGALGTVDAFVVKIESTFPDTIGVFRPSTGQFLLRNSNTAGNPDFTFNFGQSGDKPVVGDWNGDGVTDIGVFRNGTFLLATVQTTFKQPCIICAPVLTITATALSPFSFGSSSDLPVAGDWNGDGFDTIGVFSNGTFQLRNSNTAGSPDLTVTFGAAGDQPVAGDWNGDGIDTIGVFRGGANGEWFLRNSNSTGAADIHVQQFGSVLGVLPVVGDWNGDGIDTIGLLLNDSFFFRNTNTDGPASDLIFTSFTQAGDLPLAGDWNGRPDPFNLPNSGINDPANGASQVGQLQSFVTTCSDPDGWHDIATIDFKIAKSEPTGNGNGVPIALWVQFNENTGLVRFYDPDTQTWSQGQPGTNVVLSSRFAELHLANTVVVGSGPTGASVQIMWSIVFKKAAIMNDYKQYLKITDDEGSTTGFDKVGSWSVTR